MTSQAVMKRYLTAVSKTEEYANNKTIQNLATAIANFKELEKEQQAELNVLIEGAYNKLQAKGFSVKKTPTKTTTTRKTRTSSQGGLKAILAELKKKLGSEKFKEATTGTDIEKDIKIPALKKGKRIVRKKGYTTNQYGTFKNQVGTAYWESRANRFDANQPSQTRKIKLAKGGEFESLKVGSKVGFLRPETGRYAYAEVLSIDGNNVNLVVRHPKRSQWDNYFSETKERISKFLNTPSEDWKDGRHLLKIKYAEGGEVEHQKLSSNLKRKLKSANNILKRYGGREITENEAIMWNVYHNAPSGFEAGYEAFDVVGATKNYHNASEREYHAIGDNLIDISREMIGVDYDDYNFRGTKEENESYYLKNYKNKKFAKGGIIEHGLKTGDRIVSGKTIGTTIIVRNESWDEDAKVDLSTGVRTPITYDKKSKKWVEKMADGGNTSKLTEAEREQAEREIREAWEGKNIDDYVMYSDKFAKGGRLSNAEMSKTKIKDWYKKNYKTDELGDEINPNITFDDVIVGILNGREIYSLIGVRDSVVRERLFSKLSKLQGRYENYADDLYRKYGDKNLESFAKGGTTKRIKRMGC